jgi:HNH endonuclease
MRSRFGVKLAPSSRRFNKLQDAARQKAESIVPKTTRDRIGNVCSTVGACCAIGILAVPIFVAPMLELDGDVTVILLVGCVIGGFTFINVGRYLERPRQAAVADVLQAFLQQSVTNSEQEQLEYLRFYTTPEWRAARESVVKRDGRKCRACLEDIRHPRDLSVDHIRPRSKFPHLALELSNLQVLCRRCNSAKGARVS